MFFALSTWEKISRPSLRMRAAKYLPPPSGTRVARGLFFCFIILAFGLYRLWRRTF